MQRSFVVMCMLLLPFLARAQEVLDVRHYGVDQGLPQSSVWDIIQDDYGFLWVSTSDGLCRFDGYNFTTYRNNPDDSLSIGGNSTHLMALDKDGDLWLTHDQGFDKYNAVSGKFSPLYRYTGTKHTVYNKTIGEDDLGNVWVWLEGEGLLKFNKKTAQQTGKFSMEGSEVLRNKQYSRDAMLDARGNIWITQAGTSLISFNTTTEKFQFVNTGDEMFGLCAVSDSVLLIGTLTGLLRYNINSGKTETLFFHQNELVPEIYHTIKIIRVNANEFWVGHNKGIFVYNDQQRTVNAHFTSCSGGKENFLPVQSMFMDRSGNVWIGTNGDGLKKYSPKSQPPWKHYRSASGRGDIVKSIYADGGDQVFVGYFDNGLDVFSKTKGLVRKIRKEQAPWFFPGDWVYAMTGISESKLFVSFIGGTQAFGVYDFKNQSFQDLTATLLKQSGLQKFASNNSPVAISSGKGEILFNWGDALFSAKFGNNEIPQFTLLKQFQGEVINSIYIDSDKTLWVGGLNGYYVKKNANDEWRRGNPRLSTKQVKTFCEDADGNIWMGTVSGLNILAKGGEIVKTLSVGDPLINDFIYGILRDNQGDMWFSHNKGLTRFDRRKKTFRNFSADDGLQSNEFNTGAFFKSSSGELFFGGINGVNSFFPEDIQDNPQVPKIQITRIDLNDKPYVNDEVSWAQRKLTFDYTHNTLAFEFAGLEFTESAKNQYAWRMTDIDKDWIFSGNRRFARYANIPPGEYRFEVKASNNDGVWNESPAVLQIEIIPPFWQTVWFRIALITIVMALTGGVAYWFSRQRYRRKLRALEIQQKIQLDRDRISRELHDTVGAQLSLISSNLEWVVNPVASLSEIEKNKRLEEVSSLSKGVINNLRETIWALKKEEISFSEFTDKLKVIAHQQLAILPGTILEFRNEGTDSLILGPEEALHLLRICQEAIHNAVKHSQMSRMEISWKSGNGNYNLRIKDDGLGFNPSHQDNGHYGLENMRQRATEIGATFLVETNAGKGCVIDISK